jgi:uncharacterized protein (DUF1800 family)
MLNQPQPEPFLNTACLTLPKGRPRNECRADQSRELQEWWIDQLAFGPQPKTDALVQLWLGIFPVDWRQLPPDGATMLKGQIDTIRFNLSGSFTDLLTAMLADPALQISLNGPSNHRGNPNENLARELLELFTLGEGNYRETDVIAAARALTGYRLNGSRQLVLDPRRHDPGPKTILGRTASFDAPSLAVWLCQQPATARHITGRLWQRLVGPLPDPSRLQAIATAWRQQALSLTWIVRALAQSPEGLAARRGASRLDDPITLVARSLALLGSRHPDALRISRVHLGRMGQAPFQPPSVKGWPVNAEWLNLRWLQARRRGLLALLADEEIWASRQVPEVLTPSITSIPPLTLALPAEPSRANLSLLFSDPVWQLS